MAITMEPCFAVLLCLDPTATETALVAGALGCIDPGCAGLLGPWGHARRRVVRLDGFAAERQTPRRARCRTCGRTHVLASARTYPRRPDTVETVALALVAASSGLGHRRVAAQLDRPVTTVRGWLRRARVNSETVRVAATAAIYALDPLAGPLVPRSTPLGDMLEAVGAAVAAAVRRLGPIAAPWQIAVVLTHAGILAPRPERTWSGSS